MSSAYLMSGSMDGARSEIVFYVNDDLHTVKDAAVFLPLSTYLRESKRLIGTKVVCEEGDCGACTVLLGWPDSSGALQYQIVDACIQFVFQLHACHVISVEGLKRSAGLHRVQQAMIDHFGSQCGFCTPGFVMAMADLAEKETRLDHTLIKRKLTGNLCRCTGYEPILNACMSLNEEPGAKITEQFDTARITEDLRAHGDGNVFIETETYGGPRKMFRPRSLTEALAYKRDFPEARVVAGATDLGVQMNKGRTNPDNVMFIAHLHGIAGIHETETGWRIGGAANWSQIQSELARAYPELEKILSVFASEQIKNAATIGGNIVNASPIADSLPFLYVSEAVLVLQNASGERRVPINDFYKGYKTLDLQADELIVAIEIPRPAASETLRLYKVSKRKDLDISIFTAGIRLLMNGDRIERALIAYGGVGPVVLRLPKTEAFLQGQAFREETFAAAGDIARAEITPISDVRASEDYRLLLARNILLKFFHESAPVSAVSS